MFFITRGATRYTVTIYFVLLLFTFFSVDSDTKPCIAATCALKLGRTRLNVKVVYIIFTPMKSIMVSEQKN